MVPSPKELAHKTSEIRQTSSALPKSPPAPTRTKDSLIQLDVQPYVPTSSFPIKKRQVQKETDQQRTPGDPSVMQRGVLIPGKIVGTLNVIPAKPVEDNSTHKDNTPSEQKTRDVIQKLREDISEPGTSFVDRPNSASSSIAESWAEQKPRDIRTKTPEDYKSITVPDSVSSTSDSIQKCKVTRTVADSTDAEKKSVVERLSKYDKAELFGELKRRGWMKCTCGMWFRPTDEQTGASLFRVHQACHNPKNALICKFCDYKADNWYQFYGHQFDHSK